VKTSKFGAGVNLIFTISIQPDFGLCEQSVYRMPSRLRPGGGFLIVRPSATLRTPVRARWSKRHVGRQDATRGKSAFCIRLVDCRRIGRGLADGACDYLGLFLNQFCDFEGGFFRLA
jgi:hypothetical protein